MDLPDGDGIDCTVDEGVATLSIDRPDRMNAFTRTVLSDLVDALDAAEGDPTVRAVLLTGTGDDAFCSGVDMDELDGDPVCTEERLVDIVSDAQHLLRRLRGSDLPIVAAVAGHAIGAGMDIALGCDFRVVRADATLSQAYVNVGLVPGDGGAYMLPRLVGEAKAKELILTGRRISGTEAGGLGLATTVVDGDAEATRRAGFELARELAAGATVAIGHAKRMVNDSLDGGFDAALAQAVAAERACHGTADYREAIRAFGEGREPVFSGR